MSSFHMTGGEMLEHGQKHHSQKRSDRRWTMLTTTYHNKKEVSGTVTDTGKVRQCPG